MKSFKDFLSESRRIGKRMPDALYVHVNYVGQTDIPKVEYQNALDTLKQHHPSFEPTIVKYNSKTKDITFTHSPDWDSADEPLVGNSIKVSPDGSRKIQQASATNPKIYHQKWAMVRDDYPGFDVGSSKLRTKKYTEAIRAVSQESNVPTKTIVGRIGNKNFWDKHIVPKIQ